MEKEQVMCEHFNWDGLINEIKFGSIIPVIGQGLYLVNKDLQNGVLLYDYLAERIMNEMGQGISASEENKFTQATMIFLEYQIKDKKRDVVRAVRKLQKLLNFHLEEISLFQFNPLQKLALIKNFTIFLNTTYDDFLFKILTAIRNQSCRRLYYTIHERGFHSLNADLFDCLKNKQCTLVYQLFGNTQISIWPALTEPEMLDTLRTFREDMQARPKNRLRNALNDNSLLVMGYGRNRQATDWFVHSLDMSRPTIQEKNKRVYVVYEQEDAATNGRWRTRLSCKAKDFVDCLFYRLCRQCQDILIQSPIVDAIQKSYEGWKSPCLRKIIKCNKPIIGGDNNDDELPKTVFISYFNVDRKAAKKLASSLRKEGIGVWMDIHDLEPGDRFDKVIKKEIRNRPVFIPIISKKSQNTSKDEGEPEYHFREWIYASWCDEEGENSKHIIPVIIDVSDLTYNDFKKYTAVKIKNGEPHGGYNRLKRKLKKIQKMEQQNAKKTG